MFPFPRLKKVNWMIFAVTGVKKGSPNIGLAEIAVFRAAGGNGEHP